MDKSIKRVLFSLILAAVALIGGCSSDPGNLFTPAETADAAPDKANDVTIDQTADVKPEADAALDAKHDAEAGHQDAKPEADAHHEAEAAAPDALPDALEEPEASAPEPAPEAGEDAAEEPEASLPDALTDVTVEPEASLPEPTPEAAPPDVQVADVTAEEGQPLTFCQQWGTDGFISVVVQTGSVPPGGQVLAVYGTVKHTVADAGANLPYAAWEFGQAGQTQVIAKPIAGVHDLELLFAWGFTNPGNMNFNSWSMRCSPSGCNVNDVATVCAGKDFLGSFDKGKFVAGTGSCDYHLNGNGSEEVDCFIN